MNNYKHNDWTNFGDCNPEHGQLWIKDVYPDSTQDFAECVEIISGRDAGLAENQYIIQQGSIYMPLNEPDKVARALDTIGATPSLATWIDIALAFNAYHGIDLDTYGGFTVVQVGKTLDDLAGIGSTREPDVILHGNASISKYIRDNYLT